SVAYRTRASRWPTEGVVTTTIIRCPSGTDARAPPTRPRHETRSGAGAGERPRADTTSAPNVTTSARAATATRLRGGTRIEDKVVRVRDALPVAARRGDHRRVVGAERERGERSLGQRRAQLGVRRHAAHHRDPLCTGRLEPLDERAHDRPLVARRQVGPARGELVHG